MLAPFYVINLQNAQKQPIFELQKCYFPKYGSEFHQKSVTPGWQNVIYDGNFGEI